MARPEELMMSEGVPTGEVEPNICPACGFAFLCFQVMCDEEGNPKGLEPVVANHVDPSRAFHCPSCGVNIKTFVKEQNAALDKLIAWKKWAGEPEAALQNKQLSNGG